MDKKFFAILIIIVIALCGVMAVVFNSNGNDTVSISFGDLTVNGTSESDVNAILVGEGENLEISNYNISKTGDTKDNGDNSDFYGTNAAVLVQKDGSLVLKDSFISTNANGANGIFVTNGEGASGKATADIENVEISTFKDKSRGLDATFGGIINAESLLINTRGNSCAAVATDRGEGTVTVSDSELNTGVDTSRDVAGSPIIYSTGDISISSCTGTAYQSQIACIEGKNSINLSDSDLTGYGKGNRMDGEGYVDLAGVFIYQSMSGDADVGVANFNAVDSKLSIPTDSEYYKSAPMFHVTNTKANINLDSCDFSFGSNVLLEISGQNQWGQTGSNGGDVNFNSTDEELTGDITVDSISSLSFNLFSSSFSGAINPSGTFGETSLTIDSDSKWVLTGDSYLTSLENNGDIDYGSYTLYVNGKAYTASNPY